MSTDEEKIKRGMVRMPWGAWLDGPPCLPKDEQPERAITDIHPEDSQNRETGAALPLSRKQETELNGLLQRVKGEGASTLSESERKRLQWLLSRPDEVTSDAKLITTRKGRVTFA